jgi:hypothetical protein
MVKLKKKYGSILNEKLNTQAQSDTPNDDPIMVETCVNILI